MKNKAFFVLVIAALVFLNSACVGFSISVTVPTSTPQPKDTPQPTATEFVPSVTEIVPPTMEPIPEECVSPETIQYKSDMTKLDGRFTEIYIKTKQDVNNANIVALSADRENMNILIQDTKNLQPSKLYAGFQNFFLSEEQAYLNYIIYLLNGDTTGANAQLDLQYQYNAQDNAELNRIDAYCGVPQQPIQPGDIG
jgi:hypothetical protein